MGALQRREGCQGGRRGRDEEIRICVLLHPGLVVMQESSNERLEG